jgi:hypothetical protein
MTLKIGLHAPKLDASFIFNMYHVQEIRQAVLGSSRLGN